MLVARYKYDSLSRIVREDNKPLNKTTTWEYDAGGNILSRREYPFEINESLEMYYDERLFSAEQLASGLYKTFKFVPYSYATSGIRDRLMSYGNDTDELNSEGVQFEYDAIGNPETYRGKTFKWSHGRQLDAIGTTLNGEFTKHYGYKYNANGIRIEKENVINNIKTQFFLDGSKILAQKDTITTSGSGAEETIETMMHFIYGLDGLAGLTLTNANGTTNYYYKKNLQGDIIAILDNNLLIIAKYTYDAWGNHKLSYLNGTEFVDFDPTKPYTIDNDNLYIALKNPFRYRSYYYDFETGLYYLNSRYYDPEIGRFINIDDITVLDITNIAINGINLYAYCLNNPVNEVDESGRVLLTLLIAALVGMAASAIVSVGTQLITTGTVNGWQVLTDALFGGLAGMVAVSGLGAVGLFFAQGLISAGNTIANNLISGEYITGYDVASSFIFGGIMGALGGKFDLRRISQIEGSMRNTLISKFRNGGWKAFSAAFTDKTRKYTSEFVMPYLKSLFIDSAISIPILIGNTFLSDYIRAKY